MNKHTHMTEALLSKTILVINKIEKDRESLFNRREARFLSKVFFLILTFFVFYFIGNLSEKCNFRKNDDQRGCSMQKMSIQFSPNLTSMPATPFTQELIMSFPPLAKSREIESVDCCNT